MHKAVHVVLFGSYMLFFIHHFLSTMTVETVEVIDLKYVMRPPGTLSKITKELKKQKHPHNVSSMRYRSHNRVKLPTDIRFILKWSESFLDHGIYLTQGQNIFLEHNCEYHNCYMTNDKSLLVDPTYFDAVLFHSESVWGVLPTVRSVDQKFIFFSAESADYFPLCQPYLDSFYNLTWTYKLDSNVRWSYIKVQNLSGEVVGPKIDMKWEIDPTKETSLDVINRFSHKRRAAAWFVSSCKSNSLREDVAKKLRTELRRYNLDIDTYGLCGKKACPRQQVGDCLELLEEEYYFYLSFENSLSEDFVTEALLYPLLYLTVPIVYGGANYSRFLPPGSYINARELNASQVAFLVNEAIKKPQVYHSYFRWHNHYKYIDAPSLNDVCDLCETLNNPEPSIINNFRKWWTPNFEKTCAREIQWEKNKTLSSRKHLRMNKNLK